MNQKLEKSLYQIRNWRAHARAFVQGSYVTIEGAVARMLGDTDRVRLHGKLYAVVNRVGKPPLDLGCIGSRVVTTAGVNYLRDNMAAALSSMGLFKFHGSGTGVGAEAVGDTALGTEVTDIARPTGTQVNSVSKVYSTVATITYTGARAITEHGLFSAVTAGTLWDRTVFTSIPGDTTLSIQFTYTLTISDGG